MLLWETTVRNKYAPPPPITINKGNAGALKAGCWAVWGSIQCFILTLVVTFCGYLEFGNFRKVKKNHLWVPMHQKGTASCFVMWGNGEFMVYELAVYVWKGKNNYHREMLFWTQI